VGGRRASRVRGPGRAAIDLGYIGLHPATRRAYTFPDLAAAAADIAAFLSQ
jgi:hypothetical protein